MDLKAELAYSLPRSFLSKEILTLVCNHVAEDEDSGTLASMARTSRAFCDPALDALWRRIPGVIALLRLLPPDLWEVQRQPIFGTGGGFYVMTFRRPVRPDDFARLRVFAKRVKEVQTKQPHNRATSALIHPAAWVELGQAIEGPLLPNLTSLRHMEVSAKRPFDNYIWPVDFLAGPKLEYVALAMRASLTDPEPAARIFSTLSSRAPNVKKIDISIVQISKVACLPSLGVEIGGLRCLTTFKAPSLELLPEAVEHLASLPNLRSLAIMTSPAKIIGNSAFPYTGERIGRFPALVTVRIYTNCLIWCTALMKTISSPFLKELLIENRSCSSKAPVLEALFAAVGHLPCATTLHILTIFSGDDHACLHPGPTIVSAAAMLPLAALTALAFVRISGWCEVLLDDAVLSTLARAWPALQSLDMHFPPSHPELQFPLPVSRTLVTIKGLAIFARACPLLERLCLPFDARVVPELDPAPDGRHRQRPSEIPSCDSPLQHLDVGDSPIQDYVKVASYLSLFFPAVNEVCYGGPDAGLWEQFIDWYMKFRGVREQERKMRHERRLAAAGNADGSAAST